MKIDSEEFEKLFKSKPRLDCAACGGRTFRLTPTDIPDTDVSEAIYMICGNCGHKRLELIQ